MLIFTCIVYMCMYVYKYIHLDIHTYAYMYICVCVYMHILYRSINAEVPRRDAENPFRDPAALPGSDLAQLPARSQARAELGNMANAGSLLVWLFH